MTNKRGFTLIEIVVAMLLISVSIIGLNAAFSTLSATTRDLTLRQKAIIMVNNEMERLYGIYDQVAPAALQDQLDDINLPDCTDISAVTNRPYSGNIPTFIVDDYDPTGPANIDDITGVFVDNTGLLSPSNVVPIDFEHDITGRLELCGDNSDDNYYDVTLILKYPYRFNGAGDPVKADDPTLFKVDTVQVTTSLAK